MSSLFLLSQVVLWALVVSLVLAVAALARQIALIHRRIAPTGARMLVDGPVIGEPLPLFEATAVGGRRVTLGKPSDKSNLIVFISPTCDACSDLMPSLVATARSERRWLETILIDIASADENASRSYLEAHRLQDELTVVTARHYGQTCAVSGPPYALLVGPDARVQAKGLVNHFEHLESLISAARLGHASLESFMAQVAGT